MIDPEGAPRIALPLPVWIEATPAPEQGQIRTQEYIRTTPDLQPRDWDGIVAADTLLNDPPPSLANLRHILEFLATGFLVSFAPTSVLYLNVMAMRESVDERPFFGHFREDEAAAWMFFLCLLE